MRKGLVLVLAAVLVAAFAAPAMADLKVTGFYRSKAMMSNFFNMGGGGRGAVVLGSPGIGSPSISREHDGSFQYVEQRARIKFDVGTENARAVFHFESDMNWGVGSGQDGARNGGGALSADSVQLETKEVYVWFKIPDTSISAKVGMQSVDDHYAGIFSNGADMTGIFVNGQFEPVKWTVGWAKLYENMAGVSDDTALYLASVQFAPGKDMNVGVNFYMLKDDSGRNLSYLGNNYLGATGAPFIDTYKSSLYMPGANFSMNAGPAKISGFAFWQFGRVSEHNGVDESFNISAGMIDLRADVKAGPGNFFLEGFYIRGTKAEEHGTHRSIITLGDYDGTNNGGTGGNSGFGRTNMYFLFGADSMNISQCIIGCSGGYLDDGFGNFGYGLWHVATGYSQKFTEAVRGSFNIGYAAAAASAPSRRSLNDRTGKSIGIETNARVDYTVSKGLDLSLVGSYLYAGNFVTDNITHAEGPERNYYMLYGRVGFAF